MLSDRGIRQAIGDGAISIEPFDFDSLKTCSYEISTEIIWRVARASLDKDHYSMEQFIDNCCEPYEGIMLPGANYIGMSREKLLSCLYTNFSTRSSIARLGVQARHIPRDANNTSENVFFSMRTFDTSCEMPEGVPMVQAYWSASLPASRAELESLIKSGKVTFGQPVPENDGRHYVDEPHSLMLRLGGRVRAYNGKILRYGANNDDCFDEMNIDDLQYLAPNRFYIAHTEEVVEMPPDYAGVLRRLPADFGYGYIDPNSVLVIPGSSHPIILEMQFPQGRTVRRGSPICRMDLHQLDQDPERKYSGRYQNQRGPQTSLSHLDRHFPGKASK